MSIDLFGDDIITPVSPPAPYLGGKRLLSKTIVPLIDSTSHHLYAEPFIGMGGVFFRRRKRTRIEVINDKDGEVVNLFRILQCHYVAFTEMLRFQITTRREFTRLSNTPPDTLTDMQRAARFLYLLTLAFGGQKDGSFGVSKDTAIVFDVTKIIPRLEALHERLSRVVIENLDYSKMIEKYDTEKTLFYLDPPYFGGENDYGKDLFSRSDFENIADILRNLSGHFILSINDTPETRQIFKGFNFEEVTLNYSIAKDSSTKARELIIRG